MFISCAMSSSRLRSYCFIVVGSRDAANEDASVAVADAHLARDPRARRRILQPRHELQIAALSAQAGTIDCRSVDVAVYG